MLARLQSFLMKRRVRRMFSEYMREDLVEALATKPADVGTLDRRRIGFVIVNIDDRDPEAVGEVISKIVSICYQPNCFLEEINGTLLRIGFGYPFEGEAHDHRAAAAALAGEIVAALGTTVRAVHGECEALVGTFGGEFRFSYGSLLPNHNAVLRTLLELDFGTTVEIPFATMPAPRA